ncbi:acetyl-CoA synthetase-like protein [Whalleya microplaca]|nr:acetyl-CoA synthetase-like protein [Whalleya microplaca]
MNASLLEQTQCSHLLYALEVENLVIQLLQEKTNPETKHYIFNKSYEDAKWDPILILHSSGSTGAPKPVQMNHATFAVADNDRNLPQVPGRVNQNCSLWDFPTKETYAAPFPFFHLAGFLSSQLVLCPPNRPPTGSLISEIMDHFKLKAMMVPPIIVEQLVQVPGSIEKCKHLKFILYAGGPLSQAAGDSLSKVTDVCQFYGQTETGPIQTLVPRREDWASLEFHPMQEAIMEPSMNGTYELIMKRNPALEGVRPITCNFPDIDVWRTRDLFKPLPTNSNLWRFHGRADDIIVLSNGEKFNPVPSELYILAHPLLVSALIVGQGYPQAALILEPKDHSWELEPLIEEVWPIIEKANSEAPGHARITRDMILKASPSKPFDRAAKGTVVRGSTGDKYRQEIAQLYTRDISKNLQHIKLGPSPDLAEVTNFVSKIVASAFPKHDITEEDDLFVLGLDSLQTTEIISLLKSGIRSRNDSDGVSWISPRLVYVHPSIRSLARVILSHINPTSVSSDPGAPTVHNRARKMEEMVKKYTHDLPPLRKRDIQQQSGYHVILTGSTGSLGIQILVKLLSDPSVQKVYCLDRSANAQERIMKALSSWSPQPTVDPSRVSFHQADYRSPDFGLPSPLLYKLKETVNIIIHNAWKVDFNHSLDSFEAVHIRGVRNFIDFSASSKFNSRIVFVSSISSVLNWRAVVREGNSSTQTMIPESLPPSIAAAQPIGYAESKAVSEHILASAAERSGIRTSILRVGQVAGPISAGNGAKWNETEWFPLLVKTSKTLRKVPDGPALGKIDWIPVDLLAAVTWELSTNADATAGGTLQIFNLVNPATKLWKELLPDIKESLGGEAVTMHEWIQELEKVDLNDKDEVLSRPAVKILEFFRDMRETKYIGADEIVVCTDRGQQLSDTLRESGPVRVEWIQKWMKDWKL